MLDAIIWNANPELISLGPLSVRWYGLAFAIGFIVGYKIMERMFRHEGAPEQWLGVLLIYIVTATIIGARLGHVFFYEWPYYSQHPGEIIKIWNGGLASHGGTLACILALYMFSWLVTHKPASWIFDKIVVPTALVAALIRLGNLMNSEIYGGPTDLPWGFVFVRNGEILPAHPTQLYEAGAYLLLFVLLMWMYWKKNAQERPWLLTGIFFIGCFLSRFLIEFVKNNQVDAEEAIKTTWGLNIGQMLSIPFVLLGIGMVIWALTHPRKKFEFPNKFPEPKYAKGDKK